MTGGIASYKSVWLARLLTQRDAEVDVVMTRAAQEFVGAITFEAVTGRRVYTDIFGAGNALDHIRLARESAAIVVAPASADFLARAAHGHADDLLSAVLLAATCPVLLVPAMNDRMWGHPQTQHNVAHLRDLGYTVLDPDVGPLAVGEGSGPGRLPEPETILAHVGRTLEQDLSLRGAEVVVTAGATREAIDPVRFLSNHSTGKMGVAIAAAAWRRGAEVTLIAAHLDVPFPAGVRVVPVTTTEEMCDAVRAMLTQADALIMAAAPADFRPIHAATRKLKKGAGVPPLTLVPTPDILTTTIRDRRQGTVVVGFALETHDLLAYARAKQREKQLDLVVANEAGAPDAGFGADTNRVTIVNAAGDAEALPLMSKGEVAEALLDRVGALLHGR